MLLFLVFLKKWKRWFSVCGLISAVCCEFPFRQLLEWEICGVRLPKSGRYLFVCLFVFFFFLRSGLFVCLFVCFVCLFCLFVSCVNDVPHVRRHSSFCAKEKKKDFYFFSFFPFFYAVFLFSFSRSFSLHSLAQTHRPPKWKSAFFSSPNLKKKEKKREKKF